MILNDFLMFIGNSNEEIFVDTIGASNFVFINHLFKCWIRETDKFYWFNENKIYGTSVAAYFIPDPESDYKFGTGKIKTSFPNLIYGDNVSGICKYDNEILFKLIEEAFEKNGIICESDFGDFKLREIDFSVSFQLNSEEECDEAFRLFKSKRFPNHYINLEYGTQGTCAGYDYKGGDCFGSNSNNIKLYDKTQEMLDNHEAEIEPYILRLEINCFRDVKDLEFRDKSVNELFENANQWFLALLKKYNLIYDFLPKEEYFQTTETYFKAKKDEYLKDKNKKDKKYPAYIKSTWETISDFLRKINDIGAEGAYREDHKLYNACLSLTNDIGIDILYTCLDKRFNFFDDVVYRGNPEDYFNDKLEDENNSGLHRKTTSNNMFMFNKYICYVCYSSDYLLIDLCFNLRRLSIGKYSFYKLE